MSKFINGVNRILYILVDGVYLPIGCLISNGFSEDSESINTTTRQVENGWKTQRITGQSYSIDFDGLVLNDDTLTNLITYKKLTELKRARGVITWKIENTEGNFHTQYGQGNITSLSDTASIDEFVSFSGSIAGYGEPSTSYGSVYYPYVDRVLADGGIIASYECLQKYINFLTEERL